MCFCMKINTRLCQQKLSHKHYPKHSVLLIIFITCFSVLFCFLAKGGFSYLNVPISLVDVLKSISNILDKNSQGCIWRKSREVFIPPWSIFFMSSSFSIIFKNSVPSLNDKSFIPLFFIGIWILIFFTYFKAFDKLSRIINLFDQSSSV